MMDETLVLNEIARKTLLGRAFTIALLLSGNAEQAEEAVLEGIQLADDDEEIVAASIKVAISRSQMRYRFWGERAQCSIELPVELRGVMQLAMHLRHAFVLRVLVGLPGESCARLLKVRTSEVDELVQTAMVELSLERNRDEGGLFELSFALNGGAAVLDEVGSW